MALDPDRSAEGLTRWFARLRDVLDRTIFVAGADDAHQRAAALNTVTRHAAELDREGLSPLAGLRASVWVLAGATRALNLVPQQREWLAAVRNVVVLDAQMNQIQSPWITVDAASVFRDHFIEDLRYAGVARVPTILDAGNRHTALNLAVNWGMRYLIALAISLRQGNVADAAAQEVVDALVTTRGVGHGASDLPHQ